MSSSLQTALSQTSQTLSTIDKSLRPILRRNIRLLRLLSDTARAVTLLTSSAKAELHAEAVATTASLLTLYTALPPTLPNLLPRALLSILSSIQLLLEMLTRRHDLQNPARPSQTRFLTLLEAAKFALRLSLLASSPRPLTPATESLPAPAPPPPPCVCGLASIPAADAVAITSGPRSGRKILSVRGVPADADPLLDALFLVAYERRANWLVRVLAPDSAACPGCAARRAGSVVDGAEGGAAFERVASTYAKLTQAELAAEVLYIARPLVHVLLMRRFGWRSWRPWIAALMLDLAARGAMQTPVDDNAAEERRRRMALLVLYLGRSPFFDVVMNQVVRKVVSPLRCIPLVGSAASSAIEWASLLQQYWFYTSAS